MKPRKTNPRALKRDKPDRGRGAPPREPDAPSNIVFGVLPVTEALRSRPRRIERIAVAEGAREHRLSEIRELAGANGIRLDRVSREEIERLSPGGVNHQGVIAVTAAASYTPADEILDKASEMPLFVLLDGVEDPRNLGAVLRSSECAGVDGVFIPERRAVGLTDTVAKSSAGAVEHVPVAKVANLNRLIDELKQRGVWVVGTAGDAEIEHFDWDWARPTALVLGNEGRGLHRLVAENCDVLVKIPMYGKIESLNVSVAAGVILFEARRQRRGEG
jgi:23S rRNA (guanosine2251-2'-O)-methyltransferase